MKNSVTVKFVMVVLCALMLFGLACSVIGLGALGAAHMLGNQDAAQVAEATAEDRSLFAASGVARYWASSRFGGMPENVAQARASEYIWPLIEHTENPAVYYTIRDQEGNELYSNYDGQAVERIYTNQFDEVFYEQIQEPNPETAERTEAPAENFGEDAPDSTAMAMFFEESTDSAGFYDEATGEYYSYEYTMASTDGVEVTLYVAGQPGMTEEYQLLQILWMHKRELVWGVIGCALLFAVFAVYLCCCAGRGKEGGEVKAAGLNAMPLDMYIALILCYLVLAVILADEFAGRLLELSMQFFLYCFCAVGFIGCLIFVGFCFAFVAQLKMKDTYWVRNTLCWRSMALCWKLTKYLLRQCLRLIPVLKSLCMAVLTLIRWTIAYIRRCIITVWGWFRRVLRWLGRNLNRFFSMLPLTWQWLTVGFAVEIILLIAAIGKNELSILCVTACLALILYGANTFGVLLSAAQKMRSGDLETKVDEKMMVGCFRDFARELNGLADVAVVAAQKQLKSERMKTELITNVSHDIKTPLTSIINYADLLAKPHTPEEEQAYIEVLSRQSQRMKKLIEDLIEMSKATTGNIPVEITRLDAAETALQALGEFSDKLEAAGITPVFRKSQEDIYMLADGRLVWRAMSNLLSNAVKYALPGTRMYLDVTSTEDKVLISVKNISKAELNISSDELLERFVRGDTSRNTEGSGLGLNIAQSLMELQKGRLELIVDGDLFKVMLVFPKA